jgi:acetaldehyde dehydrogenase/alcohol dehydrogenase
MAFTNAFFGINHSLAHKLGGEFHIAHGRANAILLPHVIEYNAQKPTKFTSFPKYSEFVADEKFAQISRFMGFGGNTKEEQISNLVKAVRTLMQRVNIPMTIRDCGVEEKAFLAVLPEMSEHAFEDQCTNANPRYPLIVELQDLYKKAYYGK